jgi:hypothetical protein
VDQLYLGFNRVPASVCWLGDYLVELKEANMSTSSSGASPDEIFQRLMELAKTNWGEERAQEILATLESASRQLLEVSSNLPDKETEPGFYQ